MTKFKLLLIVLTFTAVTLNTYVWQRDKQEETIPDQPRTLTSEYGKVEYCYTTADNFLICKIGENK